ncbi:MAG TPA: LysR substrate-binding domain-containing protein [Ramlibacter sp.]|uniref:LysR substrate-binding domain-containing protein n=1 Tax=Ramlibacter sp. TaxID=1917967 RepID=UPI002B546ECD|nr:LysR substrate-binding domain-containing protein [Ramlibacter sp.]HVZ45747.1 LysR substrate-binding domain-containing protein [Ramlibacter sp.]
MDDLAHLFEELMAFVSVVDAGGFNAAGDRFGVPPSRLSRCVAALEQHLGTSLIVRTPRRFEVTDIGRRTYEDALAMRARLEEALAAARESQGEPSGLLRVSCPMVLASAVVGRIAIAFMQRFARVRISIESTDGRTRPFSEPADLAIQPSLQPLRDSSMVARTLIEARYVIVGAPRLQHGIAASPGPSGFPRFPAIGWTFFAQPARWQLKHREHGAHEIEVDVRFTTDNLLLVREAALAGVGIAQLPYELCREDIESGRLTMIAPDWTPPRVGIHVLYPSRRALTLAGRKFIDALVEGLAPRDRGEV